MILTKPSCILKGSSKTTKSMRKTAMAPPASTTSKAQIKQPTLTPEMNCKCTLPVLCRQQVLKKSRPPTSETALKHPLMQWQCKSGPCRTRLRNSPKNWTTKKTHQTAAAAAAAAADYVTEDKGKSRSNRKNHKLLLFLARFPSS